MSELNVDIEVRFADVPTRDGFANLLSCYSRRGRDRKARIQDALQQLVRLKVGVTPLALDAADVDVSDVDASGKGCLRFHLRGGVRGGWIFWTTLYEALLQSRPRQLVAVTDDDQTAELTLYTFDGAQARTYHHGDRKWERLLQVDVPADQPLGRHLLSLAQKDFLKTSDRARKQARKPAQNASSSRTRKRSS